MKVLFSLKSTVVAVKVEASRWGEQSATTNTLGVKIEIDEAMI